MIRSPSLIRLLASGAIALTIAGCNRSNPLPRSTPAPVASTGPDVQVSVRPVGGSASDGGAAAQTMAPPDIPEVVEPPSTSDPRAEQVFTAPEQVVEAPPRRQESEPPPVPDGPRPRHRHEAKKPKPKPEKAPKRRDATAPDETYQPPENGSADEGLPPSEHFDPPPPKRGGGD